MVPDDKMEFDHIIPHTKGGPRTVANIRKSLVEILDPEPVN